MNKQNNIPTGNCMLYGKINTQNCGKMVNGKCVGYIDIEDWEFTMKCQNWIDSGLSVKQQ